MKSFTNCIPSTISLLLLKTLIRSNAAIIGNDEISTDWDWFQLGSDIDGKNGNDFFGTVTVLSGNGGIVAGYAPYSDNPLISPEEYYGSTNNKAGHVRIFKFISTDDVGLRDGEQSEGEWFQMGSDIEGENPLEKAGNSIALSMDGYRLAVGTSDYDGAHLFSGKVTVYDFIWNDDIDKGDWISAGSSIEGSFQDDKVGIAISLSGDGNRLAVAAANFIQIYDFQDSINDWIEVGSRLEEHSPGMPLNIRDMDISKEGNHVAVGYFYWLNSNEIHRVRVYEYVDEEDEWVSRGSDIGNSESNMDDFGAAVSISADGTFVAVGQPSWESVDGPNYGRAQVFAFNNSEAGGIKDDWGRLGSEIVGESWGDRLGFCVSISDDGTRVAVGAPYSDGINGPGSGTVRVLEYGTTTGWSVVGVSGGIHGEAAWDDSGMSCSLSADGQKVAIGAPHSNGDCDYHCHGGQVRVFEFAPPVTTAPSTSSVPTKASSSIPTSAPTSSSIPTNFLSSVPTSPPTSSFIPTNFLSSVSTSVPPTFLHTSAHPSSLSSTPSTLWNMVLDYLLALCKIISSWIF